MRVLLADGVIDLDLGVVVRDAGEERLTPTERELLVYLTARAGRDVSRDELHRRVWGHAERVVSRAVTLTVHRLRRKVERDADAPEHLVTGAGGYRWVPPTARDLAPDDHVVLVVAQREIPGDAQWLAASAGVARTHDQYLVELAPDRVVLAGRSPARACAAARALVALGDAVRIGVAAGRAECLVDPVSGRTLYGGAVLERASRASRLARPGRVPDAPIDATGPIPTADPTFAPATPLIGRARELAAVRAAAAPGQLAVVVGPAGVGKTRLAEEIVRTDPAGVWVPLDPSGTATDAVHAIARALGLSGVPNPAAAVAAALAARGRCTVGLDGADGAVSELVPLVRGWIERCPDAAAIVTSRDRPATGAVIELGGLAPADGAAVLRDRCGGRSPAPDEHLARLAERLDGLPLALELVAPRLRVLSPRELAASPERLLDALVGPQHRPSMRQTLDASWDRLDRYEQRALVRCTVFAGPFAIDDAEAVLADDDPAAPWFVDTLQSLCDRYLVQREPGSAIRLRLLATVRAFAASHAELLGDADLRHARHVASRWDEIAPIGPPPFGPALVPELELAAHTAVRHGDAALALRTAHAHAHAVQFHGGADRSLRLLDAVIPAIADARGRARLTQSRAQLLRRSGRLAEAREAIDAAEALAAELDDPELHGRIEMQRALVLLSMRSFDASRAAHERALALVEQAGNAEIAVVIRLNHAVMCHGAGAFAEGLAVLEPLLDGAAPFTRAYGAGIAGALHAGTGDLRSAIRWFEIAVVELEALGETFQTANFRMLRAEAWAGLGRPEQAEAGFAEALPSLRTLGCAAWAVVALLELAELALERAELDRARGWLAQAAEAAAQATDPRSTGLVDAVWCELAARSGDPDAARTHAGRARLRLDEANDPEALGTLAVHRALAAWAEGDPERAAAELAAAEQIARERSIPPHGGLPRRIRRARRTLVRPAG